MASTKEIKDRISSVKNTQKITNAMYLISSTKMRKAKADLDQTRPYFEQVAAEIKKIFQNTSEIHSRYFYPETGRKPAENYAYLVITADKGLAGSYNYNVLKLAEAAVQKHKKTELFVVGEYGRRYFEKHNIPIRKSFLYTAQNPTFRRAREIAAVLLEEYNSGNVDEIRIIYSDMKNELESDAKRVRLLPFERRHFKVGGDLEEETELVTGENAEMDYEFYPSVKAVLNRIVPSYVAGYIYGALVDSFSAEQNARMNAMHAANDNAEQLLGKLSVEYNRVRQSAITQEITEIAAGAKAEKQKRRKESGLE